MMLSKPESVVGPLGKLWLWWVEGPTAEMRQRALRLGYTAPDRVRQIPFADACRLAPHAALAWIDSRWP